MNAYTEKKMVTETKEVEQKVVHLELTKDEAHRLVTILNYSAIMESPNVKVKDNLLLNLGIMLGR